MSKTGRDTAHILCPFFSSHGAQEIRCESPLRFADGNATYFRKSYQLRYHESVYCMTHSYAACPIYRAISEKYKESTGCKGCRFN